MSSNPVGSCLAGFSPMAALWSVPLRAAAIAVLLLGVAPLSAGAAHAAPAGPGVDFFMGGGGLNIL
jgi:hypothetical protein